MRKRIKTPLRKKITEMKQKLQHSQRAREPDIGLDNGY
jgi:hypothetical protein